MRSLCTSAAARDIGPQRLPLNYAGRNLSDPCPGQSEAI